MGLIRKIGLCVVRRRRLLVLLKRGGNTYILPGGKPEEGETDEQALEREVWEECRRHLAGPEPLLTCRSPAADRPGDEVELVAYVGAINGDPRISGEIVEAAWLDIDAPQLPVAASIRDHVLPALIERLAAPRRLYHGTSSVRWDAVRREGMLRTAPFGDQCVSLTDDVHVARYFAQNACASEEGGRPVVLVVDAEGLDAEPFVSGVWGEDHSCEWESETACWEDVPIHRITVHEMEPEMTDQKTRAVRYDKDTYRIQKGDDVVALAQRLTNDRWVLVDTNDHRLEKRSHAKPKDVAAAYDALKDAERQ